MWSGSIIYFYKGREYEIISIKYRDEYGEEINYKPTLGIVNYNILNEQNEIYSMQNEYTKNYPDEDDYFFYTTQELRKLKLEKINKK